MSEDYKPGKLKDGLILPKEEFPESLMRSVLGPCSFTLSEGNRGLSLQTEIYQGVLRGYNLIVWGAFVKKWFNLEEPSC